MILTDQVTRLSGRLTDARGQPMRDEHVVVFSPSREQWYPLSRYVRRVATSADGTFAVNGLPPNNYYVAVLAGPEKDDGAWEDPTLLESLVARSTLVSISDGQPASIQLRQ